MTMRIPSTLLGTSALALGIACGGSHSHSQPHAPQACVARTDGRLPFFAYQDGQGPWVKVDPATDGTYAFSIHAGHGAVATVWKDTEGASDVHLLYASAFELSALDFRTAPEAALHVKGTYKGLEKAKGIDLFMGPEGYIHFQGSGPEGPWGMGPIPKGPHDLMAVSSDPDSRVPERMLLRRNLPLQESYDSDPADPKDPFNLDFETQSTDLVRHDLTVTGVPGMANLSASQSFLTARTCARLASADLEEVPTMPIYFPKAGVDPSDRQSVTLEAGCSSKSPGGVGGDFHSVTAYFDGQHDLRMAAPPDMTQPDITFTPEGSRLVIRSRSTFEGVYNQTFLAAFSQEASRQSRAWSFQLTPGYGSTDVTLPDLATLAGWRAAWSLSPETAVHGFVMAHGSDWNAWPPADGARSYQATHTVLPYLP